MPRSLFSLIVFVCITGTGMSQQFIPVDNGSAINFSIKNFGINTNGSFTGLEGKIRFMESDLNASLFDISVDVNTLTTGIKARDNHLRKEEYFNAEKFPRINFVSKKVLATEKSGEYTITGTITIKGISKEISFPVTVTKQTDGLRFKTGFKLNRRDFKVGGSSIVLSDNLVVSLSLVAKKM
ncbi:MAG: YceI family protein [Bacteroidota bacterium]